jgi:hypothetical protein
VGKAQPTPKKTHKGLPRTAEAAKKHGFKKVKVHFDKMTEAEKKKYVHIAAPSRRSNAIALVRRADSHPPEHVYPGPDVDTYIVCYYDPETGRYDKNCHAVPASELEAINPRGRR